MFDFKYMIQWELTGSIYFDHLTNGQCLTEPWLASPLSGVTHLGLFSKYYDVPLRLRKKIATNPKMDRTW